MDDALLERAKGDPHALENVRLLPALVDEVRRLRKRASRQRQAERESILHFLGNFEAPVEFPRDRLRDREGVLLSAINAIRALPHEE